MRSTSCHVPAVAEAQYVDNACRGLGGMVGHMPEVVREAQHVSDTCRVSQGCDNSRRNWI